MVYYWTFFFFFNLTKTKGSTLLEIILVMLLDPELKQCCSVTMFSTPVQMAVVCIFICLGIHSHNVCYATVYLQVHVLSAGAFDNRSKTN